MCQENGTDNLISGHICYYVLLCFLAFEQLGWHMIVVLKCTCPVQSFREIIFKTFIIS